MADGTSTKLWKTSAGNTQKVTDPIGVTVPTTTSLASIGSLLYFVGVSASGRGIFTSDGTLRMQDDGFFSHETTIWHCQVFGDRLSVLEGETGAPHMYTRISN